MDLPRQRRATPRAAPSARGLVLALIEARLVYRGNGYGVFAYLRRARFTASSRHAFAARPGRGLVLTLVGYERVDVPIEERPAVRWEETR